MTEFTDQLRELIAAGELSFALDRVLFYVKGCAPDLLNEPILQRARLARLQQEERAGIVTPEAAGRARSQITLAAVEFIGELSRRIELRAMPTSGKPLLVQAPDEVRLEKIFGVNHLKSIAWLAQGLAAARSVCRVLSPDGVGTGFIISGGFLVTNNHVLGSASATKAAVVEFGFEEDTEGRIGTTSRYRLDRDSFRTSKEMDVSLARVLEDDRQPPLSGWGALLFDANKVPQIGEHVSIIQHPDGGPKMIALTANQVVNRFEHRLQYLTDTLPGSSGSPVFSDKWTVVAVHHAGGNLVTNSRGDRRFANEGILAEQVMRSLNI